MVFDLPHHEGNFNERVQAMKQIGEQTPSLYLAIIEQTLVANKEALTQHMQSVIDHGGEGLMLHRSTAHLCEWSHPDVLKLKRSSEAEATVVGYRPGTGKYMDNRLFHGTAGNSLSAGLCDQERRNSLELRIPFHTRPHKIRPQSCFLAP